MKLKVLPLDEQLYGMMHGCVVLAPDQFQEQTVCPCGHISTFLSNAMNWP